MIRHMVGWNLTADDAAGKDVAAEEIRAALEGLVGVVPGLIDLTVSRNAADIDDNSDLALVAHYESVDDLKAYIEHPAHRAAADVVRANTTGRWAIDVELV